MGLSIKKAIRNRGLSVSEVADKLGISKVALSQQINGNPTVDTLQKIATAIGVQIIDLFERDSNKINAIIIHDGNHYEASTLTELEKIVSELKNER